MLASFLIEKVIPTTVPMRMTLVYRVILILAMVTSPIQSQAAERAKGSENAGENLIADVYTADTRIQSEKHRQLLYLLLVGEMAANRDMQALALSHYLQAARATTEPAVAQQATQWAIQFQNPLAAIVAAELWAQNDPNDLQAQMVATTLLIGQSIQKAAPYLTRAIEINGNEVNQHIIGIQSRLSERSALHLKMALHMIAKERPKDPYAQIAAAQTAATLADIKNANMWVDSALALAPDLTPALQLKARLLRHEDNSDTRALEFLTQKLEQYEQNAELRLFYANALLDANRIDEAKKHLKLLMEDKIFGGQALLFLGEIYINDEQFQQSKEMLKKALSYSDSRDHAQYLLGQLAEYQGENNEAIKWYSDVAPGTYHVPALLRASNLLKANKEYGRAVYLLHKGSPSTLEEQKQLLLAEVDLLNASKQVEDAANLINEILIKLPNDPDVLFSHSVIAIQLKQWATVEKNLQAILTIDPNHADALNAMGYALSLQKDKAMEAKKYIAKALEISPNNPAYLDTMGWLLFNLGQYEDALNYLNKAKELSNDVEIAAHLGELLWTMGKQKEATVLFASMLEKSPENATLNTTVQRLKIIVKPAAQP